MPNAAVIGAAKATLKTQSVEKEDLVLVVGHGVTIPPFTFNVSPEI